MPSSTLRDHQHEISDVNGNGGLLFGTEDTGFLTLTRPVVSGGDIRVGDVSRPQEDGDAFGRDYVGGKSFGFEIGVLTDALNGLGGANPEAANLDALNRLEAVWRSEKWRRDPTKYAMLRSREAGRTFRCYGRPRNYDEAAGTLTREGYTPVVADFKLVDGRWYADTEGSVQVTLVPSTEGGFIAPIIAPITTTYTTSAQNVLTVGGFTSTWMVVEFHGPVVNPRVQIGNLVIGLSGALTYDQVVTVDPRPWNRSVLRAPDGAGLAGRMSSETPKMRDMLMEPGTYDVTYKGQDATGTSFVKVRWRDARTRP